MTSTPNVFIMSSGKAGHMPGALAQALGAGGRIDASTWQTDGIFRAGESFIDTLRRTTVQYDFGISILTPDDESSVRTKDVLEPRDNVMFELGLFLGSRGSRRALPLVVEVDGAKPSLPTDIAGMKYPTLRIGKDELKRTKAELLPIIAKIADDLALRILDLYAAPEITILPSTGLAIGYFHNFIMPVLMGLGAKGEYWNKPFGEKERTLMKVGRSAVKLRVCMPEDLQHCTKEVWARKGDAMALGLGEVDPPDNLPRSYPFRLQVAEGQSAVIIHDMPTTLLAARHSVRWLLSSDAYSPKDRAMAEEKEVHNFRRTIEAILAEPEFDTIRDQVEFVEWKDLPK